MNHSKLPVLEDTPALKRVLIVDDIRTDLHYMGKLISGFGQEIVLAESAPSALEMLDNKTDLIIADGLMPGMDGFEFVKAVRTDPQTAHIPVIMVTSLTGKESRLKAVEVGINDFITKPVDKVELRVRMNSMLKMKEAQDRVKDYQKELEYLVEKKTRALNTTLQKLQAVLNGMSDCVVTLDPQLDIVDVNQAFLRVTGECLYDLRGKSFKSLLTSLGQHEAFLSLFSPDHPILEREVEFPQWGHRIFSLLVTEMKTGDHILVMRDITEKRQADDQRARFLSILSHELCTPLNGIKGFSDVMMEDPSGLSEEYREYVGMINECGCQLEAIVEELLRFVQFYSDNDDVEESDVRLDRLISHVTGTLAEKIEEKKINLFISVEGDSPVVHGKDEHLFEIFKQIIDNAIKFNRESGDVELVLKTLPDHVAFVCRDQGKGIPEGLLSRVFDSFFQAEDYSTRTKHGLGLGLTICRKIIELYQGEIEITNRPGGGTEVRVRLPRRR